MCPESGSAHQIKFIFCQTCHGQIALDAAFGIEHLRVRQSTGRFGDIVGTNPVQCFFCIGADDTEFCKRTLVKKCHTFPHRTMFFADVRKPILPAVRINILRCLFFRSKPVGAFPTEFGTKTRSLFFQNFINRRSQNRATAFVFFVRPTEGVMFAVKFQSSVAHPVFVFVEIAETANVHNPQIHRRFSGQNPLRQSFSGTSGGGDSESIESGSNKIIFNFRSFA